LISCLIRSEAVSWTPFVSLPIATLILLASIRPAKSAPPERISGKMICEDQELIALVKKAERGHVTPEAVERFVGRKATINTDRDGLAVVRFIKHYVGDGVRRLPPMGDEEPPLPNWNDAKHVAYWVRPLNERNPRCVGLVWGRDGVPRVCFFIILLTLDR
jgi:hypothetical protein